MTAHNLILNVDSYKASHYPQYPPGPEYVSSYMECRGGEFPEAVLFGLQAFIKQCLVSPVSAADIDEAEELLLAHGLPFNRAGWLMGDPEDSIASTACCTRQKRHDCMDGTVTHAAVVEGILYPESKKQLEIDVTQEDIQARTALFDKVPRPSGRKPKRAPAVDFKKRAFIFPIRLHLTGGRSAAEIAALLYASSKTGGVHRTRIMKKLGASNAAQLVHIAIDAGVIVT